MSTNTEEPDNQNEGNFYKIVFRLTLFFALASAATAAVTYFDVLKLPGKFNGWFLAIAALLQILFWLFSSFVWQRVVSMNSGVKMPFIECFSQNALLLVGKYIPGKVWGIIIRGHRLKKFNVDIHSSVQATYVEQLNSIHVGIVFGSICWLIAISQDWIWLLVIGGCVSFFVVPILHEQVFRFVIICIPSSWKIKMQKYADTNISTSDYLLIACLYLAEWLLLGLVAVSVFAAMMGSLPTVKISLMLIGSNAVGMIAGFVALFAPAGIGVRELVNAGMLLNVLQLSEITALLILLRCWHVIADIIVGALAMIFGNRSS